MNRNTCPCNPARAYADCCGALHAGAPAADAEALMRSRYSAYVLGLAEYLLASWHPSTRPAQLDFAGQATVKWLRLKLLSHTVIDAEHAEVEFIAKYIEGGAHRQLHERSHFLREGGRWFYLDGDFD